MSAPQVITTVSSLRKALAPCRNRPIVLVPTMGALHAGHLSLVRAGQQVPNAVVVVSIFVNPLQFGASEDLDAYPRTLTEDVAKLAAHNVDFVFAPSPREVYPLGARTTVQPGPVAELLEGAARPGHFAGVLTVVNKLFMMTGCTHAVFGEKDYQQLVVIQQMVADLDIPVTLIAAPTVREDSGLAMSSRNTYLTAAQTHSAAVLSQALVAGAQHSDAHKIITAARSLIDAHSDIELDYLVLRAADLSEPTVGTCRLLVAARVGGVRLIDNIEVVVDSI